MLKLLSLLVIYGFLALWAMEQITGVYLIGYPETVMTARALGICLKTIQVERL